MEEILKFDTISQYNAFNKNVALHPLVSLVDVSKADLIKKETGKSAHEYTQLKLMDVAKERIFDANKSVSEIAYELGFKYPQHFTRVFKQYAGVTPLEYRSSNN